MDYINAEKFFEENVSEPGQPGGECDQRPEPEYRQTVNRYTIYPVAKREFSVPGGSDYCEIEPIPCRRTDQGFALKARAGDLREIGPGDHQNSHGPERIAL